METETDTRMNQELHDDLMILVDFLAELRKWYPAAVGTLFWLVLSSEYCTKVSCFRLSIGIAVTSSRAVLMNILDEDSEEEKTVAQQSLVLIG